MIWWIFYYEIRLLAIFEIQFKVLKQTGLVVFHGEVVVGFSFSEQVVGDFALGQQGVGGDCFVLDIDGVKQGDCGFDLIGALEFVAAVYGEGTYFFWV